MDALLEQKNSWLIDMAMVGAVPFVPIDISVVRYAVGISNYWHLAEKFGVEQIGRDSRHQHQKH